MSTAPSPPTHPERQYVWLVLAAVAAFALWQSLGFGLGTRASVGSGVFPVALAAIILVISMLGFLFPAPDETEPLATRPLLAAAGGVAAFILLIEWAGLVPSVVATMVTAYLGQTERGFPAFLLYAGLFAGAAWVLFAQVLNVPVALIGPR